MNLLHQDYKQRVEDLKAAIQESELLSTFIDSEEHDDYVAFKDAFETELASLYQEVANIAPLQLEALEIELLDEGFEGLFMPKILGYAVLRPRVDKRGHYYRPQEHLRQVLKAITRSAAFPELEKRIGQGVTVALALSTNVWVSNLIEDIPNRIPRNFFNNHHDASIRTPELRLTAYNRYKRQFAKDNFATTPIPTNSEEATVLFPDVIQFLEYRYGHEVDNSSLSTPFYELLIQEDLENVPGYKSILTLVGMFQEMPDSFENKLRELLRKKSETTGFPEEYFTYLASLHHDGKVSILPEVDRRMALRMGTTGKDLIPQYYGLMETIHDKGINHLEAQDAIRVFIGEQTGLSDVVECVRQTILRYFKQMIGNFDTVHYADFFEITKLFAVYFEIFDNESFKQDVRELSTKYIKTLLKRYTDKRGRDYQDIKKFVKTAFVDLNFMTEKEAVNFFKTKRKKKPATA